MFKLFLLQEGATLGEDEKSACSIQGNTNMNLIVGWYCPEQVCRTIQPILKEYIVVRNEEGYKLVELRAAIVLEPNFHDHLDARVSYVQVLI